jgi:hypothetical protein
MPSLGKHTRSYTDDIDGESDKRPRVEYIFVNKFTTSNTYRRFQHLYTTTPSYDTFLTLCAYLHILLSWEYAIPTSTFDAFIHAYPHYLRALREIDEQQARAPLVPAYHSWFQEKQTGQCGSVQGRDRGGGKDGDVSDKRQSGDKDDAGQSSWGENGGRDEGLLSADVLRELSRENPYTFAHVEASLKVVIEKQAQQEGTQQGEAMEVDEAHPAQGEAMNAVTEARPPVKD